VRQVVEQALEGSFNLARKNGLTVADVRFSVSTDAHPRR
jgi:hypothetical protein